MKALTWSSLVMSIVSAGLAAVLETWAEAQTLSMIVRGEVSQVEGEFHMAKDLQGLDTLDIVDKAYVITDRTAKRCALNSAMTPRS